MINKAIASDPVYFEASWYVRTINGIMYASQTHHQTAPDETYKLYNLNGKKSIVEHLRDDGHDYPIVILDQDEKPILPEMQTIST